LREREPSGALERRVPMRFLTSDTVARGIRDSRSPARGLHPPTQRDTERDREREQRSSRDADFRSARAREGPTRALKGFDSLCDAFLRCGEAEAGIVKGREQEWPFVRDAMEDAASARCATRGEHVPCAPFAPASSILEIDINNTRDDNGCLSSR